MSTTKDCFEVVRVIASVSALCLSMTANASWFGFGSDVGATVEVLQTTNISSKVAAIGGLPKSVRITSVSNDGVVVVGQYRKKQPPYAWQVFRYDQSNGMEILGTFEKERIHDVYISADGLVIWGNFFIEKGGFNKEVHTFRYTRANGFQDMGTMGKSSVYVLGVNGDGSVIVGRFLYSQSPENSLRYHAFRFSQSHGFEDLGTMGGDSAFARGVTADGSLVVGNFHIKNGSDHAFLYSQTEGVLDIGDADSVAAFATSVSNDGTVIVGSYLGGFDFFRFEYYGRLFLYTKANGIQKMGTLNGKTVGTPIISADGTRLAGSYIDSNGESFSYFVKISLPEIVLNK